MMDEFKQDARSIGRLLGDAFDQLSHLVQTEIRLAKAELGDKAAKAGVGVGFVFGGLLLLVPTLVLFLLALALYFVSLGMSPINSHLVAGLVGAVVSGALILVGLRRLKSENLTPDTTIRQVQKDIAAAKEIAR